MDRHYRRHPDGDSLLKSSPLSLSLSGSPDNPHLPLPSVHAHNYSAPSPPPAQGIPQDSSAMHASYHHPAPRQTDGYHNVQLPPISAPQSLSYKSGHNVPHQNGLPGVTYDPTRQYYPNSPTYSAPAHHQHQHQQQQHHRSSMDSSHMYPQRQNSQPSPPPQHPNHQLRQLHIPAYDTAPVARMSDPGRNDHYSHSVSSQYNPPNYTPSSNTSSPQSDVTRALPTPTPLNGPHPVDGDGSAGPKRIVMACRPCRARKIRCDADRPACKNCLKRHDSCSYDAKPNRRGPDKVPGARMRSCKSKKQQQQAELPPMDARYRYSTGSIVPLSNALPPAMPQRASA